jgi:hypothetical protein
LLSRSLLNLILAVRASLCAESLGLRACPQDVTSSTGEHAHAFRALAPGAAVKMGGRKLRGLPGGTGRGLLPGRDAEVRPAPPAAVSAAQFPAEIVK